MMAQYWANNPDLFEAIQKKKRATEILMTSTYTNDLTQSEKKLSSEKTKPSMTPLAISVLNLLAPLKQSPMLKWKTLHELKAKIHKSDKQIHKVIVNNHDQTQPRTAARNRKCAFNTIEEERQSRADILSDQIGTWKRLLPSVLKKFSRIPDPGKPRTIQHKKQSS
jgi:hypothetical protein